MLYQIYKLPQSSLAELARNSVIQSGFEMELKRHWIGHEWYLPGAAGNDINKVRCLWLVFLRNTKENTRRQMSPTYGCRTGIRPYWRSLI